MPKKSKPAENKILIALIILLMVTAMPPTIGSITGDGFSWNSFPAYFSAIKGGKAIANGDKTLIEGAIEFSGTKGAESADEMAKSLRTFQNEGVQIKKVKVNLLSCKQEDRIQQIIVSMIVKNGDDEYQIYCLGTVQSGKLMLIRFYDVWNTKDDEPLADTLTPEWIYELESILCTYSPG